MAKTKKRKYEVTVKEKEGTCNTPLFEKMAKKGDITSIKISELTELTFKGIPMKVICLLYLYIMMKEEMKK